MLNVFNYYVNQATTWLKRSVAYNQAYNELDNLTDRELANLGISRNDIPIIVFDSTLK
ncbi:Protein of unknown function DUF1127 [uncultured Caudovirales phage]|uniref:YjiS-like domain-containing protein n=1 Tax=uncultured Caudovirales phage TaxID=2100421 RepID=A0A6J5P4Q0_9CAUD|nr:Protein of unknown function DUF1127 [uncultured Caudovirales phage]